MTRKINSAELKKEVSARLNLALERSNLKNQSALAEMCRIAKSDVHGYLSGKSLPKSEKLIVLSEALEVSIDWILKGEESDKIRFKKVVEYIEQNIIKNNDVGIELNDAEKKLIEIYRRFEVDKNSKPFLIQEILEYIYRQNLRIEDVKNCIEKTNCDKDRWMEELIKNFDMEK